MNPAQEKRRSQRILLILSTLTSSFSVIFAKGDDGVSHAHASPFLWLIIFEI